MRLYHGTTERNAKNILHNGFKMCDSSDMMYGKGLYFKYLPQSARMYGNVILGVEINIRPYHVSRMEAIGTFEQWAETECRELNSEDCCELNNKCFERYVRFAKDERKRWLSEGYKIIDDGTQVIIFDNSLIKGLKPRIFSS